jgi:predicted nucleic acid-binding Zn ribbon protein
MRSRPDPLKNSLGRALAELALADGRALATVWAEAVGPMLARQSMPTSLVEGTLIVEVRDRAWRNALEGERGRILGRLSALTGRVAIRSIRFIEP